MLREFEEGTTEILAEVSVGAPDHEVMRAITTPDALECWMQARIDFRAEAGASFRMAWDDPGFPSSVTGSVLDLNPSRRILMSWRQSGQDFDSQVAITVAPSPDGAVVTLRHSGFPSGPAWTGLRDLARADWEKSLANLRFFVEEGGLTKAPFVLRKSEQVGAPPERAYQVWAEPEHLTAWWLREARIDLREGGSLRFVLPGGRSIHGQLLLLQKHRHIRWLWEDAGARTMIGVSFWPVHTGSRVSLTQVGFGLDPEKGRAYAEEWERCFRELSRYVG
jgi:uncharacterized protein YndB with AHSA1/START domain